MDGGTKGSFQNDLEKPHAQVYILTRAGRRLIRLVAAVVNPVAISVNPNALAIPAGKLVYLASRHGMDNHDAHG